MKYKAFYIKINNLIIFIYDYFLIYFNIKNILKS